MRNHSPFGPPRPTIRCAQAAVALVLLRALPLSQVAMAQGRILDEGVLRVVANRIEVAREQFSVIQGVEGGAGLYITATAFYPPRRTRITISPTLTLGPDSLPRAIQFDANSGADERIVARVGRRRITISRFSSQGESTREYPGAPRIMIVDDSVFALYAVPPGTAPGAVRLVSPRRDTHEDYQLEDHGFEQTMVNGQSLTLRHLILSAEGLQRHLWYDDLGRLMKVEIPSRNIYAERMLPTECGRQRGRCQPSAGRPRS